MLPVWLRVILGALAVYRLAQFVTLDDGPSDFMFEIRDKFGRYDLGDDNQPVTGIGRFLSCIHCVIKWLAIPITLLIAFPTTWGDVILLVVGLAGAASVLALQFKRAK
jgi:hypothetical protein